MAIAARLELLLIFVFFYFFTLYAEEVDHLKGKVNNISPGGHSNEKS